MLLLTISFQMITVGIGLSHFSLSFRVNFTELTWRVNFTDLTLRVNFTDLALRVYFKILTNETSYMAGVSQSQTFQLSCARWRAFCKRYITNRRTDVRW